MITYRLPNMRLKVLLVRSKGLPSDSCPMPTPSTCRSACCRLADTWARRHSRRSPRARHTLPRHGTGAPAPGEPCTGCPGHRSRCRPTTRTRARARSPGYSRRILPWSWVGGVGVCCSRMEVPHARAARESTSCSACAHTHCSTCPRVNRACDTPTRPMVATRTTILPPNSCNSQPPGDGHRHRRLN